AHTMIKVVGVLVVVLLRAPLSTRSPYTTLFRSPPLLKIFHATVMMSTATAGVNPSAKRLTHASRWKRCNSNTTASINTVGGRMRSEEHTSELQSRENLVCRLLLDKKTGKVVMRL